MKLRGRGTNARQLQSKARAAPWNFRQLVISPARCLCSLVTRNNLPVTRGANPPWSNLLSRMPFGRPSSIGSQFTFILSPQLSAILSLNTFCATLPLALEPVEDHAFMPFAPSPGGRSESWTSEQMHIADSTNGPRAPAKRLSDVRVDEAPSPTGQSFARSVLRHRQGARLNRLTTLIKTTCADLRPLARAVPE
jgi:hypothetical protein